MILVDTSIWIDLLSGKRQPAIQEADLLRFATCGPIVQEVVQGLRPGPKAEAFLTAFLALPVLSDPLPLRVFMSAADIYSHGRRKGLTIRSSIDCLIAAIAIENRVPVWHNDRDFDAIARYTGLNVVGS
ncbi:MAG: PIN domain nuclease [Bryobacterales bacterium]|nr:PIN domain nuclease [Bryobacterales bacterium]